MIDNYGVKDIKTLEGIEAIRLRPGITPLKCPYCKQPMNLIDGYLTLSHWLCKKCKKEYEFDGNLERIVGELPAAADNNCDASAISKVCNGKRNKCGGFKWKYQTM